MPGGPSLVGLAYFAGIKLAGYSAAGAWLRKKYDRPEAKPLKFGIARTVLGLVVGIAFATTMLQIGIVESGVTYYLLLFPVRFAEWYVVIWGFFERHAVRPGSLIGYSLLGSVWSYVLDLPAMLAMFALPGGVWIC